MRTVWVFTLPANGRWPGDFGGREIPAFKYLRVHHRTSTAAQPVLCSLDGPPENRLDDDRVWDAYYPGEIAVRNVGGIHDPDGNDLHFLNTDAAAVVLCVEVADTPIIDVRKRKP